MRVVPVPVLSDNYSYLVIDEAERTAAVVDCSEVEPMLAAAQAEGVTITAVLSTHHHYDHVGGNEEIAGRIPVRVYGNADDDGRIPALTDGVREGDTVHVGQLEARVIYVPAHTSGHIAYYFEEQRAVFTGDTLFAAGCGRLFEGDPEQMMNSLAKLNTLPEATKVYAGHEYTVKNLEFAYLLEPRNKAIADKLAWARARRREGQPTLPSTIGSERNTNPFLRSKNQELRAAIFERFPDLEDDEVEVFGATRRLKDEF